MTDYIEFSFNSGNCELYGYYKDNKSRNTLVLVPGSYTSHEIWKPVLELADIDAIFFFD